MIQSFEIEADGQDAKFVSSRLVLTQFKFSTDPGRYPLHDADLKRIEASFRTSERKCQDLSIQPVERILRSNRPLGKKAQPDRYRIEYKPYDPLDARREVEAYAKEFGISEPAELAQSVSRLIEKLIAIGAATGSHAITREQFDRIMTGSDRPLSLAVPKALPRMQHGLQTFRDMNLGGHEALAERAQLMHAINGITDDAIVVITGKGGCGKSTALWQLLTMIIDTQSGSPRLVHLQRSTAGAPPTFGVLIDNLRGIHSSHSDDTVALRRIEAANPDIKPPILLLGWDGIDQVHQAGNWLAASEAIIHFFWNIHQKHKGSGVPPPARLLVSCRKKQEFDSHVSTITGLGIGSKRPTYIELDVFDDSELISLLHVLEEPIAARLLAVLDLGPMPAFDTAFASRFGAEDASVRASVETLRQPIMWHCFSQLSSPMQAAFLDGDAEALAEIASSYLEWFRRRVKQRHGLDEQDIEAALDDLARAFPSVKEANSTAQSHRCLSTALGSPPLARHVYTEGVSSGLLDEMPAPGGRTSSAQSKWRWRYGFVVEYLLSRQG